MTTTMKSYLYGSVLAFSLGFPLAQVQADSYPAEELNYTVAFGPGGGNDLMSRTVVDILKTHELFNGQNIRVENRDGGSGAIGFNYVAQQRGNPYHATSTSGNFLGTPIVSNTGWTYRDFTPIGLLARDAMVLAVRSDSGYETLQAFVDAAAEKNMKIGGTGAAGPERVVAGLFAKAADIDFTYVPSQDEGGLVTSLTSSSIDAIVANPSEVIGQVSAGNFRLLGYSERERSTVFPDVPTFAEQGYDFEFSLPRGVVMPADIPVEVRDWWVETLKQVVDTPEWNEYLTTKGLSGNTIWGDEFGHYLERTDADFRGVLTEIGVIK